MSVLLKSGAGKPPKRAFQGIPGEYDLLLQSSFPNNGASLGGAEKLPSRKGEFPSYTEFFGGSRISSSPLPSSTVPCSAVQIFQPVDTLTGFAIQSAEQAGRIHIFTIIFQTTNNYFSSILMLPIKVFTESTLMFVCICCELKYILHVFLPS